MAGLTVERIVNEPTAAALACGLEKLWNNHESRFMIWVAAPLIFPFWNCAGIFQVLATSGNTQLGGDDVDARVVGWLGSRLSPILMRLTGTTAGGCRISKVELSGFD